MLEQESPARVSDFQELIPEIHGFNGDCFSKSSSSILDLKKIFSNSAEKKPVLQLGAGVSTAYGLPNWNDLILSILGDKDCLNFTPKNGSLNIKDEFKELLYSMGADQWISFATQLISEKKSKGNLETIIKSILYSSSIDIKKDTLLLKIVKKWLLENKVSGVVSYNYDDILERILLYFRHPYNVFSDVNSAQIKQNQYFSDEELNIYHVHGFLPSQQSDDKVVMDEKSYFDQFSNPFNWQNLVLLNSLINYNNVFLGISLSDTNMRRVLNQAKLLGGKKHYLIARKEVYMSNSKIDSLKTMAINSIKSKYLESLNIDLILIDSFDLICYETFFS